VHRRRFAVLLGAGASYGAWDDPSSTPPLGDALFDCLVRHFPKSWGSLDDEQCSAFTAKESRPAFESGMLSLWEGEQKRMASGPPVVTVQMLLTDLALYFAAFQLPAGVPNCYNALIDLLAQSGIVGQRLGVATLNYECLIELALEARRIPFDLNPDAPHSGVFSLWRPHGACNLLVDGVANGNMRDITIIGGNYYVAGTGVRLVAVPPGQVASIYAGQSNIPPAMSLYAPGKHSPTAPDLIAALRQRWEEWARAADIVVVIGARYVPEDLHTWRGIVEGPGSIWYVGDDASAAACAERVGPKRFTHLDRYFKPALGKLAARVKILA
jgi:hypothetical protein